MKIYLKNLFLVFVLAILFLSIVSANRVLPLKIEDEDGNNVYNVQIVGYYCGNSACTTSNGKVWGTQPINSGSSYPFNLNIPTDAKLMVLFLKNKYGTMGLQPLKYTNGIQSTSTLVPLSKFDSCKAPITPAVASCAEAGLPLSILTDSELSVVTKTSVSRATRYFFPSVYYDSSYSGPNFDYWITVDTTMYATVKPQGSSSSVTGFPKIDTARIYQDDVHNFDFTWETTKNTPPGYYDITMTSTVTDTKCDDNTDIPVTQTMTVYVAESFDTCRADVKNFAINGNVGLGNPISFRGEKLTVFQDWDHTGVNCEIKGTLVGGETLDSEYIFTITNEDTGDVVYTTTGSLPVNPDYSSYNHFSIQWVADVAGNYEAQVEVTALDPDNKCGSAGTYSSASTTFNIGVDADLDDYFYVDGQICSNCDCDDDDPLINPGMPEICDGIDNNCDGLEDEDGACDEVHSFCDEDLDEVFSMSPKQTCIKSDPGCTVLEGCQATPGLDCDDDNNKINPEITEKCENEIDDNCNTNIDCADSQCTNFFKELFNYYPCKYVNNLDYCPDGYIDLDKTEPNCEYQCTVTGGEICDGKDNDCNGEIDEGVLNTFYEDLDGDGFGNETSTIESCVVPANYAAVYGDCDDSSSTINPDANELCDNVDNNCEGTTDEGCACSKGDIIPCKSAGVCSDYKLICGLDGFVPACDYSDIPNYEETEVSCDGLNNDCDVDSEGKSLADDLSYCCSPQLTRTRVCRSDPKCPGVKGAETCVDFKWSGQCVATCVIDTDIDIVQATPVDIIFPRNGEEYSIYDEAENKPIKYKYGGQDHCQYKLDSGLFIGIRNSTTIPFTSGNHKFTVKCGSDSKESSFSVIRKTSNDIDTGTDTDIFIEEGISQDIVDESEKSQDLFEVDTIYAFEDGAVIIKHTFTPDKPLTDASLYLHIPKCLANYTDDIEWETKYDELILEDPLIAWHFLEVNDRIDLSYKVHGNMPDEECLKKIKLMGLADIVKTEEPKGLGVIIWPIFVVILVALGALIHQRVNKNMQKPLDLNTNSAVIVEQQSEQEGIKNGMHKHLEDMKKMKFKDKLAAYNHMKTLGFSEQERDWILKKL
jgi:hypothetical protein